MDRAKAMNLGLWGAQLPLAALFAKAGVRHVGTPREELVHEMRWVRGRMGRLVRFIGASELAGAVGLLVPPTAIAAAGGLTLLMAGAASTHLVRREFRYAAMPLALGAIAALIAWGRSARR